MALISLWKAPQNKRRQELFLKHGVLAKDVDNQGLKGIGNYGFVFFARLKSDARIFARCYGAGIIEFEMDSADYAKLDKIEQPAPGLSGIEVAIPYSALDPFNAKTLVRKLHL